MDKKEHMIIYKESIWSRIKNKFLSLFSKKKNQSNIDSHKENKIVNTVSKTKEEIMEIYNKVKSRQMEIEELDGDTLDKVILLIREEMDLINKKIENELNDTKMHLHDLKSYIKDIELAKKNS